MHLYRIYGDNILETELIKKWGEHPASNVHLTGTYGRVDSPIYVFQDQLTQHNLAFQLCPGYDRWPNKPLGDLYGEKPDLILTEVSRDNEESDPKIAIESCDAIHAGNQSWQRFRRATDAAENDVPYIFVTPFLDWEHETSGSDLKAPRYQSAAVTLGQLSLSTYYQIPSLQIYRLTSWCEYAQKQEKPIPQEYKSFSGINAGVEFLFSFLRYEITAEDRFLELQKKALSDIYKDMFRVAEKYSNYSNTYYSVHQQHPALNSDLEEVSEEYAKCALKIEDISPNYALHKIDLEDFADSGTYFQKRAQSKTCNDRFFTDFLSKINWKVSESKQYKIDYLRQWNINASHDLTNSELDQLLKSNFGTVPTGYKSPPSEATLIGERESFRDLIEDIYPETDSKLLNWIFDESKDITMHNPLFFVPLYAYKPSGDSRPDRGLLPLLFGLFPELATTENLFVLIYSIYTPHNWEELLVRGENELWNVIRKFAGALFVDETKEGVVLDEID